MDGMRVAFLQLHNSELGSKQMSVARGRAASGGSLNEILQVTTNGQRLQHSVQRLARFHALLLPRR